MDRPIPTISSDDAELFSDALADVICWFYGFRAGNSEAQLPPKWGRLIDLNAKLKAIAYPGDGAPMPF